jgi:hypothetical protein
MRHDYSYRIISMVHACGYSFMTTSGETDSATRSDPITIVSIFHFISLVPYPPSRLIASNIPEEASREEERIAVDR